MNQSKFKQVIYLLLLPPLIAIQFSCIRPHPRVGGPCTYSTFAGSAEITELKAGQNGYWMVFKTTFVGAQPKIDYFNQNSDSVFIHNPSGYTTPEWLSSKGIVIGAKFEMSLSMITSGSCTPVVRSFPSLPGITN